MTTTVESAWVEFADRLRKFIRSRVADDATADDLLQDVFLRISRRSADWDNANHLEGWLFLVARNAVIDHYRTRRQNVEFEDSYLDESSSDPEFSEDLKASFRRMVDGLPEPYREAVVLTEFEGLSQIELSKRLGISVSGAKSRVQRGRKQLKKMLEDCCRFEFDRRGRVIDCLPRAKQGCAECD